MSIEFSNVTFTINNHEPRCPCILLLDTSGSMAGMPISELNAGLVALRENLLKDEIAMLRVEIAIITFGGVVRVVQDFVTVNAFTSPTLTVEGATHMGAGINLAMDMLESRKRDYKNRGVPYYRPWIFLVTDGAPTDAAHWQVAVQRVQAAEANKKLAFFVVGIAGANMQLLAQINPARVPVALKGLAFRDMFLWLSTSMKSISRSEMGSQVLLQSPAGWSSV